jgi:hypothetical protein
MKQIVRSRSLSHDSPRAHASKIQLATLVVSCGTFETKYLGREKKLAVRSLSGEWP